MIGLHGWSEMFDVHVHSDGLELCSPKLRVLVLDWTRPADSGMNMETSLDEVPPT
jgi:hypothetical protein